MTAKTDGTVKKIISVVFCTVWMLFSAFAGMNFTGRLVFQILLTLSLTLLFLIASDLLKIKIEALYLSAGISTAFWVVYAVVGQMLLKGTFFIFSTPWRYMFYYDSIGMVFIVLITVTVYYRIKAFIKKDVKITEQYEKFYSAVSVIFTAFYITVLVYCFFICRIPGGDRTEPNFDPLDVFRVTFMSGRIDYERLVLFLGNIAIFIPLGYLLYGKLNVGKRKIILVFLPTILSSAIEFSQYYFGMGHPDIDDVILNVIGFYTGVLLKMLFNRVFVLKK